MSINRDRGKRHERVTASMFEGKRVGTMCGEDIMHPVLSIECKSRKSFVGSKWMQQARRNNKDGKIPIVVLHVHGERHSDDLVIISAVDFVHVMNGDSVNGNDK